MASDPSLLRFRAVVEGALSALDARRQEVNDLNVFPVADGDTGDNMALTLRAVMAELDRLASLGDVDDIGREQIVQSVARAALLGARGNSGVILSQLIRGAAEELISRPGELVDPVLVAAAMARAAEQAYGSVRAPAEGTMLTVVREMGAHLAHVVAHAESDDARLSPDTVPDRQDAVLARVLEEAVTAGEASVERGPELLPILRESGVVDAGGYGLVLMFAGVVGALRGREAPALRHHAPARVSHPQHASSSYRYCVNFAVTGLRLDQRAATHALEALGDSVLVVGDPHTLKVHVHTDDPNAATGVFAGEDVSRLDVADMHEQVEHRVERLATPDVTCGVLAVATGTGVCSTFGSFTGVSVLDGGPTLNPSTYDLLSGIHAVPAEEVIVLPNSTNVVMAAERAADLSEKQVRVVPTRSMQAGLAAALALDPSRPADENFAAMTEALDHVRTGGVAPAARRDGQGRFDIGDAVGYVDEELVAWGDPTGTLRTVLQRIAGDGAELVTAIRGDGAPLADDAVEALAPADVEVEVSEGGQPSWWWLLSAE
jgi:uncharacterized protein